MTSPEESAVSAKIARPVRGVVLQSLKDPHLIRKIHNQKMSLLTSYGPNGRLKIVGSEQNQEIIVGSSSSVLLKAPMVGENEPVIKLITSAVSDHLKVHYDAGLFSKILCLSLVECGLEMNVPSCVVARCYQKFAEDILNQLREPSDCPVVYRIDIAKLQPFLELLQGIIRTKPSLCLSKLQTENLSILLLKAFMKSSSSTNDNKPVLWPVVHFQVTSNCSSNELFEGLLLDLVHYSKNALTDLFCDFQAQQHQELSVALMDMSLTPFDLINNLPAGQERYKVFDQASTYLLSFAQLLVDSGVRVVLNQRVTCDQLKMHLQKHNILAIDRIGKQSMDLLQKITKAMVISCMTEDLNICKGKIDNISLRTVRKKQYVFIENSSASLSSIVCSCSQHCIQDMKHVCWASLNALDKTLSSQNVLAGAGKCELYLTEYLKKKHSVKNSSETLSCSTGQFSVCLNRFCKCLGELGRHLHHESATVIDCFETKLNALMVAIQTASLVLDIKFQIKD